MGDVQLHEFAGGVMTPQTPQEDRVERDDWCTSLTSLPENMMTFLVDLAKASPEGGVFEEHPAWGSLVRCISHLCNHFMAAPLVATRGCRADTDNIALLLAFVMDVACAPRATPLTLLTALNEEFADFMSTREDLMESAYGLSFKPEPQRGRSGQEGEDGEEAQAAGDLLRQAFGAPEQGGTVGEDFIVIEADLAGGVVGQADERLQQRRAISGTGFPAGPLDSPSLRVLSIRPSDLVRVLEFNSGVQLAVPFQTLQQIKSCGLSFSATIAVDATAPLPLGVLPYSQVIRLKPHLPRGEKFVLPVRVSVPIRRAAGASLHPHHSHTSRALRFFVLEHEEGQTEWQQVRSPPCFAKGMADILMSGFCDMVVAELGAEDPKDLDVAYVAYLNKKPNMDEIYRGKIAIWRTDCPVCVEDRHRKEKAWMTEGYEDVDQLSEEVLEAGCSLRIKTMEDEGQVIPFKGSNVWRPVRFHFGLRKVMPYFLSIDGTDDLRACLEFSDPLAAPADQSEQKRKPSVSGLLLWSSTPQSHEQPLDFDEVRLLREMETIEVHEMCVCADVQQTLDALRPELLIFSCHNKEDQLLLQVDTLAHDALCELLKERMRRGLTSPVCILLATCNGESLAQQLYSTVKISLTIYWNGEVPNRVASLHTPLFCEELLKAPGGGSSRYRIAFLASRARLPDAIKQISDDAAAKLTLQTWGRRANHFLRCWPPEDTWFVETPNPQCSLDHAPQRLKAQNTGSDVL